MAKFKISYSFNDEDGHPQEGSHTVTTNEYGEYDDDIQGELVEQGCSDIQIISTVEVED